MMKEEGDLKGALVLAFSELGYLKALVFLEVMAFKFSKRFSMGIFERFPRAVRTERV